LTLIKLEPFALREFYILSWNLIRGHLSNFKKRYTERACQPLDNGFGVIFMTDDEVEPYGMDDNSDTYHERADQKLYE